MVQIEADRVRIHAAQMKMTEVQQKTLGQPAVESRNVGRKRHLGFTESCCLTVEIARPVFGRVEPLVDSSLELCDRVSRGIAGATSRVDPHRALPGLFVKTAH